MPVPTWISGIGHIFSDIIGGAVGATWVAGRHEISKKAGEAVHEKLKDLFIISPEDREEVMKVILRLREEDPENVDALFKLLMDLEHDGHVIVNSKRYMEAPTLKYLLLVDPPDRGEIYQILNAICRESRAAFFTLLDIMNDDGWSQPIKMVIAMMRDAGVLPKVKGGVRKAGRAVASAAQKIGPAAATIRDAAKNADPKVAAGIREFRLWLEKKGVR